MEQQVAEFPPVALFRRHPAVAGAQPELAPPQHRGRRGQRGRGVLPGLVPYRLRHPGHVARRGRRQRPGRAGQPVGPGHHAAGQRQEQQQVDGREPGRREHVEQGQPGQPRGQPGMRGVVLLHGRRVDALLRQQRPGHAGHGQQEQQDQRGAHRGQLAPAPAQPAQHPVGRAGRRWCGRRWRWAPAAQSPAAPASAAPVSVIREVSVIRALPPLAGSGSSARHRSHRRSPARRSGRCAISPVWSGSRRAARCPGNRGPGCRSGRSGSGS